MSGETETDRQNNARAAQLANLDRLSQSFGRSLSNALTRSATSGRGLDGVLSTLGSRLATLAAKAAVTPLRNGFKSLFDFADGADPEDASPTFANGAAFRGGRVTPFASGGVVAAPTYFPMAGGAGLMGEAGPEAIMPLRRGSDGKLGVAAGAASRPVSVNVTIATPDPAAFRRSEAQVAATLARAVARGQRAL